MLAIISHVDTIQLIREIQHRDHFVEHLRFRKPRIHNDFPDQP